MDWANVLLFVLAAAAAVLTVFTVFTEYLGFPAYWLGLTASITCVYRVVLVLAELVFGGIIAGNQQARSNADQNQTPP